MIPEPPPVAGPSVPRPIAGTRHRRNESYRSLRSQASESSPGSSLPTPMFDPASMMHSPATMPPHAPPMRPAAIPTAFLDLDFVVIRANGPFEQILAGGRDLVGRQLGDFASLADGDSFQNIRAELRNERDSREPSYMPPIFQSARDQLRGVMEDEVDRLAAPFTDRSYTWIRIPPGPLAETFPARVRLAKAETYFVVITLPTFQPMTAPPQPYPAALVPPTAQRGPQGQLIYPEPPPPSHYPFAMTGAQRPGAMQNAPPPPAGQGYPPPPQLHPYPPYPPSILPSQQLPSPLTTTRLPAAEPPTAATPFTPRTAARQPAQQQPPLQLPPLLPSVSQPAPAPGPSTSTLERTTSREEQPSDDDDSSSPRKRRRVMGIDDVLQ
jgi:hypothetical protein